MCNIMCKVARNQAITSCNKSKTWIAGKITVTCVSERELCPPLGLALLQQPSRHVTPCLYLDVASVGTAIAPFRVQLLVQRRPCREAGEYIESGNSSPALDIRVRPLFSFFSSSLAMGVSVARVKARRQNRGFGRSRLVC